MTRNQMALRVLIGPSELPDRWLAVCIDRYMVAEGDSPEEAANALKRVFRAEIALGLEMGFEDNPLERLPKAPKKFEQLFNNKSVSPPPPKRRTQQQSYAAEFEQRLALSAA